MKSRTIWIVGFICFIFVVPLTGYAEDELAVSGAAASITSSKIDAFQAALEKDGLIVKRGQMERINIINLCCSGISPTVRPTMLARPI